MVINRLNGGNGFPEIPRNSSGSNSAASQSIIGAEASATTTELSFPPLTSDNEILLALGLNGVENIKTRGVLDTAAQDFYSVANDLNGAQAAKLLLQDAETLCEMYPHAEYPKASLPWLADCRPGQAINGLNFYVGAENLNEKILHVLEGKPDAAKNFPQEGKTYMLKFDEVKNIGKKDHLVSITRSNIEDPKFGIRELSYKFGNNHLDCKRAKESLYKGFVDKLLTVPDLKPLQTIGLEREWVAEDERNRKELSPFRILIK